MGAAEEAITPNCPDNPYCAEVCESAGFDWRGWCNLSTGACTCQAPRPGSGTSGNTLGYQNCTYTVVCYGSTCVGQLQGCSPAF